MSDRNSVIKAVKTKVDLERHTDTTLTEDETLKRILQDMDKMMIDRQMSINKLVVHCRQENMKKAMPAQVPAVAPAPSE